jgi:aminopeptidase N
MNLLNKISIFLLFVGLSFAQNNPAFIWPFIKTENLYFAGEEKTINDGTLLLHPEYDVLLYDINMTMFPDSQKIKAETSIHITVTINIQEELLFDFAGLQLDSVLLDSEKVPGLIEDEMLVIKLDSPLMAGEMHIVNVYYQGTPEKGLYFRYNWYDDLVIYSHNEPYDARYWFPCKDDPSDKAKLLMTVTLPETYVVLSNGTLIDKGDGGKKRSRYIWQENYPIATYLISVTAGPYQVAVDDFVWEGEELLLEYYVYANDLSRGSEALKLTKEMLEFYSHYIGRYPFLFDKYSMSEVPFREASAMENQTATTMGDFVMDNEEVIAHELAHQWWGDALTPQSFADIWLNEGFATYFDALFTEHKYGEEAFLKRMDDFFNFLLSDGSLAYPIYDPPPQYLFGRAVYMKGAWVLHMLRLNVGDQIFEQIIKNYFETYNYLNVSTGLFMDIAQSVSGQSLEVFFDQWLNYSGMPVLLGSWDQQHSSVQLAINQEQSEPVYQFDLEVMIEGISDDTLVIIPVMDRRSDITLSFSESVSKIIIDPNKKILNTNNSPLYYIPTRSGITGISPNPSDRSITIKYQVEKPQNVEIVVYNILGQLVDKLLDEKKTTGVHQVDWDGSRYTSGTYYCVLTAGGSSDVRKMTLIK